MQQQFRKLTGHVRAMCGGRIGVRGRLIGAIVVPLMISCGLTPPAVDVTDDERLQVTDTLREACEPFGLNDTTIGLLIQIAEQDRLDGVSEDQSIDDTVDSCQSSSDPDRAEACATCSVAIIEQVYGE